MLVQCNVCHREYVASGIAGKKHYICSRCLNRSREQNSTKLGLHPALERKLAADQNKPMGHHLGSVSNGRKKHLTDVARRGPASGLSDLAIMPKIPGFELSYQIGKGAMGSVYRAREKKTGCMVAIKVLSQDLSQRTDLIARFEREACALKSLDHPNVVSILDAGQVEGTHYFVMEYIDGITLRTRMNRGSIDLREATLITAQILKGLGVAHEHGIIHRDLKPENVLLSYDGRDFSRLPSKAVLVDFGLVGIGGIAFDPHPNLTRSRVTMGTVNYMAPEQHVDAKRVDHRSDLYSVGVIMFEMLTGELPLGRYLLPNERGMDLPKEVDAILGRSLARTLEQRYSRAEDFLKDVSSLSVSPAEQLLDRLDANDNPLSKLWHKVHSNLINAKYAILAAMAILLFIFGIRIAQMASKSTDGTEMGDVAQKHS